jgi:hypothetical protein
MTNGGFAEVLKTYYSAYYVAYFVDRVKMDVYAYLAIIFLLLLVVLWKEYMFSRRLPCPPGPKGLPLIGNIRDIPPDCQWLTYASWSHKFSTSSSFGYINTFKILKLEESDVIYLNLAGTNLLVVNSLRAAVELFEKRYAIYSDKVSRI